MFDCKCKPIFEWCMVGYKSKNKHKKTCVEKKLEYMFKTCNNSTRNNQHNWEGTYLIILITQRIFTSKVKRYSEIVVMIYNLKSFC